MREELFVGCSNGLLAVADADLYRLVARLPVEPSCGNVSFDSGSNLLLLSNPTGTISVVSQRFPERYRIVSSIPTKHSIANTVIDIAKHHLIVLATASRQGFKSHGSKWPQEMIITIGKLRE